MSAPAEEETPVPIIPDCTQYKFYRPPAFLHGLRPKRKVAIVFGYIGEKYCGLQWNKNPLYPTIEESLLKALYETDMISLANMSTVKVQQRLDFERASRTDKGVHALRNVVSMNVMLPYDPAYVARRLKEAEQAGPSVDEAAPDGKAGAAEEEGGTGTDDRFSYAEAKRLLNVALPPDIHVYEVVPVTRSFNAYLCCGWRRYEYYLPTYCFMSREEYCEQYFPAALAPAKPSLAEVGVQLADAVEAAAAPEEGSNVDRSVQWGKGGGDNGYGRKSRGHFPMRKSKKQRLEAEEGVEAAKAADAAASAADPHGESEEADRQQPLPPREPAPRLPPDQATATHFHDGIFEQMILFRSIPEEAMRAVATKYRLSSAQLNLVRDYFAQYEGTHFYHNFTPGGRGNDPSCSRYMKSITVSEPFVVYPDGDNNDTDNDTSGSNHNNNNNNDNNNSQQDNAEVVKTAKETRICSSLIKESVEYWSPSRFFSPDERVVADYAALAASAVHGDDGGSSATDDEKAAAMRASILQHMKRVYGRDHDNGDGGVEVVRIEIEGQSFLLNQIRKMIGAVICCCATNSEAAVVQRHLLCRSERWGIPMAPANGLFLSFLDFSRYNLRLNAIQSQGANGGKKRELQLEEVDPQELVDWRARTVAVVLRNELAEDVCGRWMRSLRCVLRLAWDKTLP